MAEAVMAVAESAHGRVRAMVYEPIETLRAALGEARAEGAPYAAAAGGGGFEKDVDEFLIRAALGLASRCGYAPGYLEDPVACYDYELESERNDVRDLIRGVGGDRPCLRRLLATCVGGYGDDDVAPYHVFSALAKPVGAIVKADSGEGEIRAICLRRR